MPPNQICKQNSTNIGGVTNKCHQCKWTFSYLGCLGQGSKASVQKCSHHNYRQHFIKLRQCEYGLMRKNPFFQKKKKLKRNCKTHLKPDVQKLWLSRQFFLLAKTLFLCKLFGDIIFDFYRYQSQQFFCQESAIFRLWLN